jgi:hypothetical protein
LPGKVKVWLVASDESQSPAPKAASGSGPTASPPTTTCPGPAAAKETADSASKTGSGETAAEKAPAAKTGAASSSSSGQKFDPAVVSAGQAAFERSCTKCHEASRALERTKDLAGWRTTVRRMAARRGADIASEDIEPIATYLASRGTEAAGGTGERAASTAATSAGETTDRTAGAETKEEASTVSAFATLAPLWRGGNVHDDIQNPGFFPETWVGGTWQGSVLSARVTVCAACHGVKEDVGTLQRLELVEAVARVDLSKWLGQCCPGLKGGIEAGRFVVPFGAFSAQVNPGLFRTVSKPLIFNMGQRVFKTDLGEPVLPMPYSDEGVNLNLEVPVLHCDTRTITATLDAYLVNGLEGSNQTLQFYNSRDLVDNNRVPAGGGRITLGDANVRAGASLTGGRFNDPEAPGRNPGGLDYAIYGFDIQARYKDLIRVQFEYAHRKSDRASTPTGGMGNFVVFDEKVEGLYVEGEVRPWEHCCLSLLARYDWLGRHSPEAPVASTLPTGTFDVHRLTWGVNCTLWRQSLLMVNHEIWFLPEPVHDLHVFGVRYVITF